MKHSLIITLMLAACISAIQAKSISINFGIALNDSNAVDPSEISIIGIPTSESIDGSKWNNINLRPNGAGAPTTFTTATQSGNNISLIDSTGANTNITLTSAGSFYSNFANTSSPNQNRTGDAGLMQSFINIGNNESITLTGLQSWAPNGYRVIAVFDIGPVNRTYAITMNDGNTSQAFWTNDTAASDSDSDNDGIIEWSKSTALNPDSAVNDSNHALFGAFTGNTLTISGDAPSGRATLSGLQIIALTDPPATINTFTATPQKFISGQTVTLNWDVSDADSVTIDNGIGNVPGTGSIDLTPSESTAYTLTATRGTTTITSQVTTLLNKGKIVVYLLGGQSNMQGTARSSKLPANLKSIPQILLYANGSGVPNHLKNKLIPAQPANGSTFGPEIGFAAKIHDLRPTTPIAILKYAGSGTSLEIDWRPGNNPNDTTNFGSQFNNFLNTINNGLAALRADGWEPVIEGMGWQQGEQDAKAGLNAPESSQSAADYGTNLSHFIDRIRQQFAADAAPSGIRFVLGQVLPYAPAGGDVQTRFPGRDLVRQAELDLDENSASTLAKPNTATVPTTGPDFPTHAEDGDSFKANDEVHLNHTAQLNLGRAMANKMLNLTPQTYNRWSSSHHLSGSPSDDDDQDGLNNLSEFHLASNPNDPTDTAHPIHKIQTIDSKTYLTLQYTRNLNAANTTATAQLSQNLIDWNTNTTPILLQSTKNPGPTATITYRTPWEINSPANSKTFLRLLITP